MQTITLAGVQKNDNVIRYEYSVSEGVSCFFTDRDFIIHYPESIEQVPDAIAVIPFVCNALPIVWLADCELILPELDEAFYNCIPEICKGYETMFPESIFAGKITVGKVVPCDRAASGKCAMFYSGGLDSVQTLISHLDEKPTLISIWGSDIRYDNEDGWNVVHSAVTEASKKYDLPEVVIRSTFREFDNEGALHQRFSGQLKDGWWHGVKHGIGLLGHVAPYAWLHGLSTMYIASSNCPADGHVRCASNPLIDNHVRFANCKVVHDGFEFSRQDKVRNIVLFCKERNEQITMHVCWVSQEGSNCCRCEKCYRTIAGIIAEGDDPEKYGFDKALDTVADMQCYLLRKVSDRGVLKRQWTYIQNRMKENEKTVRKTPYWKYVKWMLKADFVHPEFVKMPLLYRVRVRLSYFKFYQWLHNIKEKL